MTTVREESNNRAIFRRVVQALDPIIVLVVGIMILASDYFAPTVTLFALALLLLPFLLRLIAFGEPTTPSLANVPLFILLLLLLATCWVTPAWQKTWPQLVTMIWGMALCLAVINWVNPYPDGNVQQDEKLRQLSPRLVTATILFLGIGVVVTAIGLLGMGNTAKVDRLDMLLSWVQGLPPVTFGDFNSNNVGGVIVLFVPFVLALAIGPLQLRQRSVAMWLLVKTSAIFLSLYFGVALLLTQTRGAWLAAAVALVVILSLLGRRGWILLMVCVALTVGATLAVGPEYLLGQLTVYDASSSDSNLLTQDRNLSARFILWQRALHGIADAPLTGMGLGAFAVVAQEPYPEVAGFVPDPDRIHAHNILLQMGVDFGVPGVIVFVAWLTIIGVLLAQLIRRAEVPSLLHTWSLGLLGSFVAYLGHNMFNVTGLGATPGLVVWFLFGLCIGAGEWAQRQSLVKVVEESTVQPAPVKESNMSEDMWGEWERRAWAVTAGSSSEKE